jgi:predicted N-formylglutamate amidohydrolase
LHTYDTVSGVRPILAPDEQPPFEEINTESAARIVITCDHARNTIPRSLDQLGVSDQVLSQHVAYDIGCEQVCRYLYGLLDAPLVLSRYSRLVVDCNRHLNDPTSILEISDGHEIPGNTGLTRQQAGQRVEEIFVPYHNAIAARLEHIRTAHGVPALVSVHSFTPVFEGFERPWHIGILWNRDGRIALPMLEHLRTRTDLCIGENKPYHAREPVGYTMDTHAESHGYPHALIEIRQDLIQDADGAKRYAEILAAALSAPLADDAIYTVQE